MSTARLNVVTGGQEKVESAPTMIDLRDRAPTPYGSDLVHSRQWESWD